MGEYIDEMEVPREEIDTDGLEPQDYWERGLHRTSDGAVVKIATMSKEHLAYAIEMYKRSQDVVILEHELLARN